MIVTVIVEVDINEKQYDDTYADTFHDIDRSTMELIKTKHSMRKMRQALLDDVIANAQNGISEWAKRLSFDINIKNNIIE